MLSSLGQRIDLKNGTNVVNSQLDSCQKDPAMPESDSTPHSEDSIYPKIDAGREKGRLSWPRIIIGVLLGSAGLYFIFRNVNLGDVAQAVRDADPVYLILAVLVIVITIVTKTWRWRLIFTSGAETPTFSALFWSLSLGQFFNVVVPLRTGEIARIVALDQQEKISKSRTLSTLVIEKTLDMTGLVVSVLVILPFVALPDAITERWNTLAIIVLLILPLMFIAAVNSRRLVDLSKRIGELLPQWLRLHFIQILEAGLEGLSALKSRKLLASLSVVTLIIFALSVLTPLVLFYAFGLPFGVREAIILNLLVTLSTAPPSTPGRIVVFLAIVRLTLEGFGAVDSSLVLSYALTYLIVVYAPSLLLGGLALAKGGYRYSSGLLGKRG